jgi:hypothetical protein
MGYTDNGHARAVLITVAKHRQHVANLQVSNDGGQVLEVLSFGSEGVNFHLDQA